MMVYRKKISLALVFLLASQQIFCMGSSKLLSPSTPIFTAAGGLVGFGAGLIKILARIQTMKKEHALANESNEGDDTNFKIDLKKLAKKEAPWLALFILTGSTGGFALAQLFNSSLFNAADAPPRPQETGKDPKPTIAKGAEKNESLLTPVKKEKTNETESPETQSKTSSNEEKKDSSTSSLTPNNKESANAEPTNSDDQSQESKKNVESESTQEKSSETAAQSPKKEPSSPDQKETDPKDHTEQPAVNPNNDDRKISKEEAQALINTSSPAVFEKIIKEKKKNFEQNGYDLPNLILEQKKPELLPALFNGLSSSDPLTVSSLNDPLNTAINSSKTSIDAEKAMLDAIAQQKIKSKKSSAIGLTTHAKVLSLMAKKAINLDGNSISTLMDSLRGALTPDEANLCAQPFIQAAIDLGKSADELSKLFQHTGKIAGNLHLLSYAITKKQYHLLKTLYENTNDGDKFRALENAIEMVNKKNDIVDAEKLADLINNSFATGLDPASDEYFDKINVFLNRMKSTDPVFKELLTPWLIAHANCPGCNNNIIATNPEKTKITHVLIDEMRRFSLCLHLTCKNCFDKLSGHRHGFNCPTCNQGYHSSDIKKISLNGIAN